jgi:hypothetical protein
MKLAANARALKRARRLSHDEANNQRQNRQYRPDDPKMPFKLGRYRRRREIRLSFLKMAGFCGADSGIA